MVVAVTALFLSVFLLVWLAGTRSMSLGKTWVDLFDRVSMRPLRGMMPSGGNWEGQFIPPVSDNAPSVDSRTGPVSGDTGPVSNEIYCPSCERIIHFQ